MVVDGQPADVQFVQIEQGVLGALVLDAPRVAPEVFARCRAEDFADGMHKRLFEIAAQMFANGDEIDALTLCGKAGDAQSRKYIMDMMEVTPTASHFAGYIQVLLDQSKRRKAAHIGSRLCELAALGAPIEDLQAQVEALAEAMTGGSSARAIDMKAMLFDFFQRVGQARTYLDWGFEKLNRHLFCEPGDYVVIGARPSAGKTAFALNLAAKIAAEKRVVFFSLETRQEKIADRMMSTASLVPLEHIKRGQVDAQELDLLALKKHRMLHLDFCFVPAAGMTLEDIRAETLRSKADVAIVDYLGLIDHRDKKLSEYAVTTANSKGLQRLAHGTGTTVVALSQLSRSGSGMEALRGSGQIEQDADAILLLEHHEDADAQAPSDADKRRVLRIVKNKDGICGKIKFWFEGQYQRFTEEWDGVYDRPAGKLPDAKATPQRQSMQQQISL